MAILNDSKLEYLITDSPTLLSLYYGNKYNTSSVELNALILKEFNSYTNINIFLNRCVDFDSFGRVQTQEESDQDSKDLMSMLNLLNVSFHEFPSTSSSVRDIISLIEILDANQN